MGGFSAAVTRVRNGVCVFAPQQNANLLRPLVRDVTDDVLQQPCSRGSIRLFAADIHGRPPSNRFESFDDGDAVRAFAVHVRSLPITELSLSRRFQSGI
jgi:hypothetical protein